VNTSTAIHSTDWLDRLPIGQATTLLSWRHRRLFIGQKCGKGAGPI